MVLTFSHSVRHSAAPISKKEEIKVQVSNLAFATGPNHVTSSEGEVVGAGEALGEAVVGDVVAGGKSAYAIPPG